MSDKSNIEWTDATWNPIRGCSVVSEGCRNCYAMRVAARFSGKDPEGYNLPYAGLAYSNESGPHWTGKVKLIEEHLEDPLRWKRPRRIFVNSMSDLFHESIPDKWIFHIFDVMYSAKQHVFQILTKRPERMLGVISHSMYLTNSPLSNVWLGVSCEDQKTADERIPLLLQTPSFIKWVSAEPLLGPVNLEKWLCSCPTRCEHGGGSIACTVDGYLDWVVAGGESGPGARPMHPDWARSLRDQCVAAGVPFFFKQWGEWIDNDNIDSANLMAPQISDPLEYFADKSWDLRCSSYRVGKKAAGRLLDGREWNEYPKTTEVVE